MQPIVYKQASVKGLRCPALCPDPSGDELLAAMGDGRPRSDADIAADLLIAFGRALRRRPVTQEIMRWELLERNELTNALARYREQEALKLIGLLTRAHYLDVQAIGSLLAAGQAYLTLRAKTADVYNGLRLDKDADWDRVEDAIRSLTSLAFSSGQPAKRKTQPAARRPRRKPEAR